MEEKRIAVLIDADNVSGKYIQHILDEVSNFGIATYKRIYGDWTKPSLASWKSILLENSIIPIQQYSYTTGKNSTDSAMIIDAMDILYSQNVQGFCIVSSDSDFTRLAVRLRESGMHVVGMGERKTPAAFISACNEFKYLEVLENSQDRENSQTQPVDSEVQRTSLSKIKKSIVAIVDEVTDEDQWAPISEVGNRLQKRFPDFDVRNYGFSKLTPFVKSLGIVDINSIPNDHNPSNKLVYVRLKNSK